MNYLFLLICLFFLHSCGDDKLKKVEKLGEFRILGFVTSTPEVAPGDTVNDLRVIFSDVDGGGRLVNATTVSCIDPGISFGASVKCDHDPSKITGTFSFNTATDDDTNGFFTGTTTAALTPFTVPSTILVGRSTRDQFNGVGYIVILNLTIDGKESTYFKRITATTRTPRNTNPNSSTLLLNGVTMTSSPEKNDLLSVGSSSEETYSQISIDGTTETLTEKYQVAWYVSEGKLNKPKSFVEEDVKYLDDKVPGTFLQLALVRDERGGLELLQFNQ